MEKKPMKDLLFIELLSIQSHFIEERSYLINPETGVSDRDSLRYDKLSCSIDDINTAIEQKFSEYSVDAE